MRLRLAVLTLALSAVAPAMVYAADASEEYSSYEDEAYVATRERGNYVFEEEPIEEQVVVRRRIVEEIEPPIYERRIYVRQARRAYAPYYGAPDWRDDRPRRRVYRTDEAAGGW